MPWSIVTSVEPDREVTVMATYLPLRRYRSIPRFMQWTLRIRRQLARSDGLIGYALEAQLLRKQFWTVSAWTSKTEVGRFNRADPHAAGAAAIRPLMGPTTFVTWSVRAGDLPVPWDEVHRRVAQADAS